MSKPLVIQLREAKASFIECANNALREGIPCYLLEPIIAELHTQISASAQAEYEQAQMQLAREQVEEDAKKHLPENETNEEATEERGDGDERNRA